MNRDDGETLKKLQNLLGKDENLSRKNRLPPERVLAIQLGVSRSVLRKALAVLEEEGKIWRHVGRGTFVGPRPDAGLPEESSVALVTNPTEIMEARLILEPKLAALAALRASMSEFSQMETCLVRSKEATDLFGMEYWDHQLHLTIARSTDNSLLLSFFKVIHNALESDIWGSLKKTSWTAERREANLEQHAGLIKALKDREASQAERIMRDHLETIKKHLLDFSPA